MKKKVFVILLSATMAFVSMVGCGKENGKEDSHPDNKGEFVWEETVPISETYLGGRVEDVSIYREGYTFAENSIAQIDVHLDGFLNEHDLEDILINTHNWVDYLEEESRIALYLIAMSGQIPDYTRDTIISVVGENVIVDFEKQMSVH